MALLENKRIILGSSSPRRKELLAMITPHFEIISPNCNEDIDKTLPIDKAIEQISLRKANSIDISSHDDVIITADTLVVLNDHILGKPNNRKDGFNMLKLLSNNTHQVITGVTIKTAQQIQTFSVSSSVTFSDLSDQDINDYLDTDEPYDKAGAYAIQGLGGIFVCKINGDYFNIIGLPVNRLKYYLNKL